MLNLHLFASEKKCPFSLVPVPLSPLLYLTPYVGMKQRCISCVLCSLSSPLAMDEFCILSFLDLKEQDKGTTTDHVSTSCVSHYTQINKHPSLEPMTKAFQPSKTITTCQRQTRVPVVVEASVLTLINYIECVPTVSGSKLQSTQRQEVVIKKAWLTVWSFIVLIRLGKLKLLAEVLVVLCCIANSPMNKSPLCFLQMSA